MKQQVNIQDVFLRNIKQQNILTTVFLTNGVPVKGTIKNFDTFTVELEADGKQQMIFKHAISTIVPTRSVSWMDKDNI